MYMYTHACTCVHVYVHVFASACLLLALSAEMLMGDEYYQIRDYEKSLVCVFV